MKTYQTPEEFFDHDELCISVWKKYALRNREGEFLETSPEQTIERVMKALASVDEHPEETYEQFVEACANFQRIVPQGSVLYAAGNDQQIASLSNCVVISPPQDSMHGIFKTAEEEAQLFKRRIMPQDQVREHRAGPIFLVMCAEAWDNLGEGEPLCLL